ncbi:hypothetical protein HZ326_13986 [Fusarium oxysporum f. sp. albedinis]|nr:hypothetical protein HZ326_13986 [Fusarium oxysporum f. sp. albedinis]
MYSRCCAAELLCRQCCNATLHNVSFCESALPLLRYLSYSRHVTSVAFVHKPGLAFGSFPLRRHLLQLSPSTSAKNNNTTHFTRQHSSVVLGESWHAVCDYRSIN